MITSGSYVTALSFTQEKGVKILLTQDTEFRAVQFANMDAVHCSTKTK